MVIDTSALIAIHRYEPERAAFRRAISTATERMLPATVYLEFVLATRAVQRSRLWLDRLIMVQEARIVSIDHNTIRIAADAAERYGRGSGHPARLNFGDCLSYAVAKRLDAALLFKGDDFLHTDVRSAVAA